MLGAQLVESLILRAPCLCEGDLELCQVAQQALLHVGGGGGCVSASMAWSCRDLGAQLVALAGVPFQLLDGCGLRFGECLLV